MTSIRVDRMESVRVIRLDRGDRRNAFDDELILDLTTAFLDAGEDEGVRVVLLEGEGESFCAGADLEWMRRASHYTEEQNRADALRMAAMFDAIATCPRPVLTRVHGACMGGGIGLVAASDIVVAARDSIFAFTEVRLGLIPAVISPYVLSKVLPGDASRYFLTGERFTAEEARRIGLVQIVAEAGQIDQSMNALITEILAGGPAAQVEAKRLLRAVPRLDAAQAQETTASWIARIRASKEGREGIRAFLERRPPSWRRDEPRETR